MYFQEYPSTNQSFYLYNNQSLYLDNRKKMVVRFQTEARTEGKVFSQIRVQLSEENC